MDIPENVTVYSGKHKTSGKLGQKLPEHVSKAIEATEKDHASDSDRTIGKKPDMFSDVIKKANKKLEKPEKTATTPAEPPAGKPQQPSFNPPGGQNK